MAVKNWVDWKVFFVLLAISACSIVAIMPYILTIQGDILKAAPLPLPWVLLISVIQSIILFAFFVFIGLKLSKKSGLSMPIIVWFVNKRKIDVNIKSIIKISVLFGLLTGIVIIFLDFLFTKLGVKVMEQFSVPIWQGFLASFYGGISEEIALRLFFMSLIVWIFSKFTKSKSKLIKNNLIMWSSIILASILFGIGHLPITSSVTTITPLVIVRAILLNGIGGVVFGWLYWKKGLESAMIAHFSTDIVIQVFLPLFLLLMI